MYNRPQMNTTPQDNPSGDPGAPLSAVEEAVRYGIDISQLRANLHRTPAERLRRHDIALRTANMLRKAMDQ